MIRIERLTLRRGAKVVLEGASLTLHPGEKVGLVGRNGAGKSSLFSLLAGRLQADAGEVQIPPRWRFSEVAQEMPEVGTPATQFVLEGDLPLQAAQAALADAEARGDGEAIAQAHVALEEAGAFDARARGQALLLGLGFRVDQLDAAVNSFSGGWRMRLQLARALMCPADLLLLDEPTNHLDLDALVWLENWLQRLECALLVISHDREFLDAVTRVTVHVDEGRLTRYGGNYSLFESQRAERLSQAAVAYSRQQERIAHLQRFIDRFKAKATKAKQAQSRVKALARMEKLAPVLTASEFEIEFREPPNLPNPMLVFDELACGYRATAAMANAGNEGIAANAGHATDATAGAADTGRPTETVIVRHATRTVLAGQRVGILGANGQGKSTLVKTIARTLPPLGGTLTEGKGLRIGYFAQQELDLLQPDDGPLMHLVRVARDLGPPAREQELRDFLGSFRFGGEMAQQPVGSLSGGEKARLVLAMIVWQRPNLLLLDEPTNHLDLNTREALSVALNEFEGTVLLVSHDRALLREVCDEFWLVTRGGLLPFDGDLDDYQRWLLDVSKATARGLPAPPPPKAEELLPAVPAPSAPPRTAPKAAGAAAPARGDDRKAAKQARAKLAESTRPLRIELTRIDERLARLAQEKAEVEAALADPATAPEAFAELGRRLAHVQAETAMLEERWLEASSQLDALTAAAEA